MTDTPDPIFRSVVAPSFKAKYAERGNPRGCGDWLHRTLARYTLDENKKLDVKAFLSVCRRNGVDTSHWSTVTPGWQGRLRMSGRLALAPLVASCGFLTLPDRSKLKAPKVWCKAHIR